MSQCPQCNREFTELPKECPACKTDLTLLVDHTQQLTLGLGKAEEWTRSGELAKATWAYLAVLEVDPNNPKARKQISRIATAVRQFDTTSPKKRWSLALGTEKNRSWIGWLLVAVLVLLLPVAFAAGFYFGGQEGGDGGDPPPPIKKPGDDDLMGG